MPKLIASWGDLRAAADLAVTNPGQPVSNGTQRLPGVALAGDVDRGFRLRFVMPPGSFTFPAVLRVNGHMDVATSSGVALGVKVQAVTPGDALNVATTASFGAETVGTVAAVPASARNPFQLTVTIPEADLDGVAAGDEVTLEGYRRLANPADNATGDWVLRSAELVDSSA